MRFSLIVDGGSCADPKLRTWAPKAPKGLGVLGCNQIKHCASQEGSKRKACEVRAVLCSVLGAKDVRRGSCGKGLVEVGGRDPSMYFAPKMEEEKVCVDIWKVVVVFPGRSWCKLVQPCRCGHDQVQRSVGRLVTLCCYMGSPGIAKYC